MKKFSKLLCLVLALVMTLSLCVGAFSYTDEEDFSTTAKQNAAEKLFSYGIMNGTGDGKFSPKATFTREQMAKVLTAIYQSAYFEIPSWINATAIVIPDINDAGVWAKDYITYCVVSKLLAGDNTGAVNPKGAMTYATTAVVILRALGVDANLGKDDTAKLQGSNWATNAILYAGQLGLFEGISFTNMNADITREDLALMLINAMNENMQRKVVILFENDATVKPTSIRVEDKLNFKEVNGIVTNLTTIDIDKVDYLVITDTTEMPTQLAGGTYYYPLGTATYADLVGKNVTYSYYVDGDTTYYVPDTFAVEDTTTVTGKADTLKLDYLDKDGKTVKVPTSDGTFALSFNGAVVVSGKMGDEFTKFCATNAAIFYNNSVKGYPCNVADAKTELDNESEALNATNDITISFNANSFVAVETVDYLFKADATTLKFEATKTDKVKYVAIEGENFTVDSKLAAVKAGQYVVINIDRADAGTVDKVEMAGSASLKETVDPIALSVAKLTATVKGSTYTFKLAGTVITLATDYLYSDNGAGLDNEELYKDFVGKTYKDGAEDYVIVWNGCIVDAYAKEADNPVLASDTYLKASFYSEKADGKTIYYITGIVGGETVTTAIGQLYPDTAPEKKDGYFEFEGDVTANGTYDVITISVDETALTTIAEGEAVKGKVTSYIGLSTLANKLNVYGYDTLTIVDKASSFVYTGSDEKGYTVVKDATIAGLVVTDGVIADYFGEDKDGYVSTISFANSDDKLTTIYFFISEDMPNMPKE